ncbi:RNA 2',3'-cyclic phosphodiesterase [Halosegnis longus]|uniref:RNA 2',3'-cyclic phosphodiesterase n=1 Tax=Halosegnis longus TaxID=2216012 RepID=UPI00129EDAF3|nr:RNA 2',3'-cyclic phosphodiesterase [Halosegnis longus]
MRTFVSVPLGGLSDAVADAQTPLDMSGVDPIDPTQAHVTLKFLGETDDPDAVVEAIERAVAASEVQPFDCTVAGYGVFPSLEYISVIWAGITEGSEQLTTLHEHVERETTALGFDAAEHNFTPHATLARMRDARSKSVIQEVVAERDPNVGTVRVDGVELTQSMPTDGGPEYETVAEVPL